MTRPPYLGRALLLLWLLLPLLFLLFVAGTTLVAMLVDQGIGGFIACAGPAAAVFLFLCMRSGRNTVLKTLAASGASADSRWFVRYQPLVFASGYTLTLALAALLVPAPADSAVFGRFASVFSLAHLPSSIGIVVLTLFATPNPWVHLLPPLVIQTAYACGMSLGFRELRAPRTAINGRLAASSVLVLMLCVIAWRIGAIRAGILSGQGDMLPEHAFTRHYHPWEDDNRLVPVPSPSLSIEADHPRIDGATAAYPVYAAAAQALYRDMVPGELRNHIGYSTTPRAYQRLIAGDVDLILAAQPSPAQRAAAEAAGRPLDLTPIAREAFVFFVHDENPVTGLTTAQLRDIYTKRVRNWSAVGGNDEPILAFQRPPGSGSQTALELMVMQGEQLTPPLREEYNEGMGGIIQRVASYRNSREALGYSFRYFATAMSPVKNIKLLEIDGVAPTRENIRSGAYPYTADVFIVTAGTRNPNVGPLLDWFTGPQGRRLVEETGYVAIDP